MDVSIKISTAFSFLWSLFLVGVVFLTAKPIATWFLGDSSLTYTILATCPLMILMSISNIVKGHFLGLAKIKVPSAINISRKDPQVSHSVLPDQILSQQNVFSSCYADLSLLRHRRNAERIVPDDLL